MDHWDQTLDIIDDDTHSLLEPPSLAYTSATVRRAFIVWMYCGQRNKFQEVANYYHHLEAFEDTLPADLRAQSRHHEFNMFLNQPPSSQYLNEMFPKLYSRSHVHRNCVNEMEYIKTDQFIFDVEALKELPKHKKTTTDEIIEASRIIRKYCKMQQIPVKKFIIEYKEYSTKCALKTTVDNVTTYIKRKILQSEIDIANKIPTTFDFLETSFEMNDQNSDSKVVLEPVKTKPVNSIAIDKDIKLSSSCSKFFDKFNTNLNNFSKYNDKTVSDPSKDCNTIINSRETPKSRSVENVQCKEINLKTLDRQLVSSHFMNLQEITKLQRIPQSPGNLRNFNYNDSSLLGYYISDFLN